MNDKPIILETKVEPHLVDKTKKTLVVECGGGLCNRIANIINGFYYYEKYNFEKMYFLWPKEHDLNCRFSECFQLQDTFEVIDGSDPNFEEIKSTLDEFRVINLRKKMKHTESILAGRFNSTKTRGFIIRSPGICPLIPYESLAKILKSHMLIPAPGVSSIIKDFSIKNNLQEDKYIGVHIRRTDHLGQKPNSWYAMHIRKCLKQNKNLKFFVCSDDSKAEKQLYSQFPANVIIRRKKHQPTPLMTQIPTVGTVGYTPGVRNKLKSLGLSAPPDLPSMYNIYRPPEVVIAGVIDFFLLAQSMRIIGLRKSAFHRIAALVVKSRTYKKVCFVTTIIANSYKEADKPPIFRREEAHDYFLFTNLDPSLFDTAWTVIRLENKYIDNCPSNIIKSRYIKFMAWEYLQKTTKTRYNAIVYCDGIYTPNLKFDWQRLARDVKKRGLIQKEHIRGARQECKILLRRGRKDSPARINKVVKWIDSHHLPRGEIMTENCFFAYDPNNNRVTSAFDSFWDLFVTDISNRDQPLWSYFLWKWRLKPLIYDNKRWGEAFVRIDQKSIGFNQHHY